MGWVSTATFYADGSYERLLSSRVDPKPTWIGVWQRDGNTIITKTEDNTETRWKILILEEDPLVLGLTREDGGEFERIAN